MLIEIYTDTLYDVRDEYVDRVPKVLMDGKFKEFSDMEDLRRSLEEG